jgi:SRSO17 transposase
MDGATGENEAHFSAYVEALAGVIGHANRVGPLKDYCIGLILPGERKSVEPMAAVIARARTRARAPNINRFCTFSVSRDGPTRRCWPRCAN